MTTGRTRAGGMALAAVLCWAAGAGADEQETARGILRDSGVRGGLIVHVGCGSGELTGALRAGEAFTVHGLATRDEDVVAARAHLRAAGLYGPVSVDRLAGRELPYAENLVNLVVVEDAAGVPQAEVMRVLAPGGAACVRDASLWRTTRKAQPATIDDWSHFLHDAGNNAVAADRVVGQPRRLQWLAEPLWLRSHETASGVQAQVASGGRLLYAFDEGPVGIVDERLPEDWGLYCRDAFNGRLLWKRPMPNWGWRQWGRTRVEGKDPTAMRALRTSAPMEVQRRLVADERRVYVTLGFEAPLSILDAADGKTLATVEGVAPVREIILSDGVVVAHVREDQPPAEARRGKNVPTPSTLVGIRAETGQVLWRQPGAGQIDWLMYAAAGGKVFYQAGKTLVCLNLKTGKELWRTEPKTRGALTLVAAGDAVLLLGSRTLEAVGAADGRLLWNREIPPRAGGESPDLFVVGGVAWPGMISLDARLDPVGKSDRAMVQGFDVRTGEPVKRIVVENFRSPEHHHRCYRNKATSRFIISGMEGAEFLDLEADGHGQNNWIRGACKLGIMPCYGLLYAPADQCFCEPGGKLLGYTAVGPAASSPAPAVPDDRRLERGQAYGQAGDAKAAAPGDWPTFRQGPARHGSTPAAVGADLAQAWRVKLGGRLTAPVAAGGRVFVARVDAHSVHCLDAATGAERWSHTAGGRIDSPPTVHRGLVLFGSADGRVTCLRESDGRLVWRLLAAPYDRRIMCFDQIESVWPVHGSVLVREGVAYVAAGRSTYLDGGIHLYGLDPATGRVVHTGLLEGPHRRIDGQRDVAFHVPGANSDVLVSESGRIYMRQKRLTPELKAEPLEVLSTKGEADAGLHVFSTAGLLDGSWYNRTFWMYSKRWPGFQLANQAPKAGQLLVVDDETTYAVKVFYRRNVHSPMFFPGREGYLLFADRNTTEPQIVGEAGARAPLAWLPQSDYSYARGDRVIKLDSKAFGGDKMIGYTRADPPLWTLWLPVRVRAMVKTRDVLFVAGPPDAFSPDEPLAALQGRKGASLVAVSAKDGRKLAEMTMDCPPVFDGMIATPGRLLISLEDGTLVALRGNEPAHR